MKVEKYLMRLVVLFLIIIGTMCKKSPEENMRDAIAKLTKAGNFWLYVEIDSAGVPGDTWGFMEVTETIDTIKGEQAYKIDISYNFYNSAFQDTFNLWVISNDSLIYVYGAWPEFPLPSVNVVIPINLDEGDTWTYFYPYEDTVTYRDTLTFKVLTEEDVSTPTGTFKKCIKVEYTGTTEPGHSFIWFRQDVGIVRYYNVVRNERVALLEYNLR